ncbi:MAG: Sensor protein KdpD [Turneriella sp.]|nr:Sensor protein KdpD [Turneriella sp.]
MQEKIDIDADRPDADLLLSVLKKTESTQRGKLRIFFGMAAGVGKTYAMLTAAHRLKEEGVDVIVGFVETHGRVETEALVKGLEVLPRTRIPYENVVLEEFDLDAALKRKPHTIIVDELPHTNARTSRHPKRYQDILELLDAGINVMTAFNVQHLESVADSVEAITNVHVQERVPDSFVDMASDIELVDLVPEQLIKRLEEGKVYAPEKAAQAANNFFRKGNLTALREMALHFTAKFVDKELQDYRTLRNIQTTWRTSERILVAVSPSQTGENLIRLTRQRAFALKARWIAVYIDVGKKLTNAAQKSLEQNLNLARELGAEVLHIRDTDVVTGLIRTARQKNATQIVVGKNRPNFWQKWMRLSLLDRLIAASGSIEIHVAAGIWREDGGDFISTLRFTSSRKQYVAAIAVTALATLAGFALNPVIGYTAISFIYLSVMLILGLLVGQGPLIVAATISALAWDYFFIPPHFTIHIEKLEDFLTFTIYFIIALVMGNLMARLRLREQVLMSREERVTAVYNFSRILSRTTNVDETVQRIIEFIGDFFRARVSIYLRDKNGKLNFSDGNHPKPTPKEASVASWAFEHRKPAGRYTDTLPLSASTYYPLISTDTIVGVLGVRRSTQQGLAPDQEEILFAFINHAAITIERDFLASEKRRARIAEESEKLNAAILNSLSHELRTPIAIIRGAVSALRLDSAATDAKAQRELLEVAEDASQRLNLLVSNLLDMSRIEAGKIRLNKELYDLRDLLQDTLEKAKPSLESSQVELQFVGSVFTVSCDYTLLQQALLNIVSNAVFHNKVGVKINIHCRTQSESVRITIADNGVGIPNGMFETIFDKFTRSPQAKSGGTGLGLTIAKSIIELHGGTLTAQNRNEGGALFDIYLPR